jgi:hypothetical protein
MAILTKITNCISEISKNVLALIITSIFVTVVFESIALRGAGIALAKSSLLVLHIDTHIASSAIEKLDTAVPSWMRPPACNVWYQLLYWLMDLLYTILAPSLEPHEDEVSLVRLNNSRGESVIMNSLTEKEEEREGVRGRAYRMINFYVRKYLPCLLSK